jgi:hypothetical protein
MIIDRLKLLLLIVNIQSALSGEETANIIKDNVIRLKSAVEAAAGVALENIFGPNGICADSPVHVSPKPIDGRTDKLINDYLRDLKSMKAFANIDKAMAGLEAEK